MTPGAAGPRAALALAALLAGGTARAAPTPVHADDPPFDATVPDGFAPCASARPPPELLACLQRPPAGDGGGPLVVLLVRLRAVVPQRALTARARAELRRADPVDFTDAPATERATALGFPVEVLVGSGRAGGRAMVRLAAAVPLVDDSVLVAVVAPADRAPEARGVLRGVLGSFRAETAWRTPAQRAYDVAARAAAWVGVGLGLAYAVAAWTVLRRREGARRARAGVLAAVAVAWAVFASWLLTRPGRGGWCAAAQALALAVLAAALAARQLRATRHPGARL